MSLLQVGEGAPSAWACPAENVGLPADDGEAERLEHALAKFCANFFGSLVSSIGRSANRAHLFTETVNIHKERLESADLLAQPDIAKLASELRTQLVGYLMPTYVELDQLEECQDMLAAVLRAERAAALPLPAPPPHQPPPPPPSHTAPGQAAPPSGADSALDNLQRDLDHVAHWVSAHQRAHSRLGDNEDKEEKPKKVLKMKVASKCKPYKRLEEEVDSEEQVTSGEARPPKADKSEKSSDSPECLSPEPTPPSLSGSDTDEPPYSMTFVLAPDSPDQRPATSADGNSQAVAAVETGASLQVSRAEASQAVHGATGIDQDVQSPLDVRGSNESKSTECEASAMAVTEELQGMEPAPGSSEEAAVPVAACGRDVGPAAAAAGGAAAGSKPAPRASEPGPSRNWVRAALWSLVNAMKATRPSVAASAPGSPAYSPAASATGANGSGNGDGTDGSALSGLKAPSLLRPDVSCLSSQREALEELQRQHGLLRSALLRHANRLWLEVRGRPRVARPPVDARLALLTRFRHSLRNVEAELRDAQRHLQRRAERLAAIGRQVWAGRPLPAAVAAAQAETVGVPAALAAPDLGGGVQPPRPPPPQPTAAAPGSGSGSSELSCGRLLRLLCSCCTCLPRRQ